KIMHLLHKRGARVEFHDPYVDDVVLNGTTLHRTELTNNAVARADLVAVLTPHSAYDLDWISEHARLVFDARNAYNGERRGNVIRL
ncbi:MAG: UDP binding domain-containing protein, partial [Actinomycetota bacterium]